MPSHIKGVINLRGKIIPTVDLRIRFGLAEVETSDQTCIVVVQVDTAKATKLQMGLIVDAVEEVIHIAPADIEETPDFGDGPSTRLISWAWPRSRASSRSCWTSTGCWPTR